MRSYKIFTSVIFTWGLLGYPIELWASKCTGSLFAVENILHVTHIPHNADAPYYHVNISAPDAYDEIPFSHMAISKGEGELFAEIKTQVENDIVVSQIRASNSELANWEAHIFYKDNSKGGTGLEMCKKTYVGSQSLEHNKNKH